MDLSFYFSAAKNKQKKNFVFQSVCVCFYCWFVEFGYFGKLAILSVNKLFFGKVTHKYNMAQNSIKKSKNKAYRDIN